MSIRIRGVVFLLTFVTAMSIYGNRPWIPPAIETVLLNVIGDESHAAEACYLVTDVHGLSESLKEDPADSCCVQERVRAFNGRQLAKGTVIRVLEPADEDRKSMPGIKIVLAYAPDGETYLGAVPADQIKYNRLSEMFLPPRFPEHEKPF